MLSSNSSIDAIAKAPEVHKILLENDRFRVLEVKVEPGKKTEMHWHPDNIVYVLSPGTLKFTKENGEEVSVNLSTGQLTQSGPAHMPLKIQVGLQSKPYRLNQNVSLIFFIYAYS
jgi:quercetin dioxygenase-like cupin family protein